MLHIKTGILNLIAMGARTILAMIGILVGTGSVVAIVSCGEMATQQALAQFKVLGTDMMALYIYDDHPEASAKNYFKLDDALKIKKIVPNINVLAPYMENYVSIYYEGKSIKDANRVIAGTHALMPALRISMQMGRFISDFDKHDTYCVIGQNIYKQIKLANPIGKQINVGNTIFTIVGVAAEWPKSSFFIQDVNNSVIVSIENMRLFGQEIDIENIVMRLTPHANIPIIEKAIRNYIKSIISGKTLLFRNAQELITTMRAQANTLNLMLGIIGGIALLVGGVGVMNIMLVSVLERRHEIGLRLALGAKRRQIQWMFLSEAFLMAVIGGILGIIFGLMVSFIIAKISNWTFTIFFLPPFIGFIVSALTGIFFGYYPAYRASQLDPIEALRTE